ncbi:MerR family transcriptional regulator [Clostridium sp. D2Q-14]|uniref:MerR family transcriptional regulator n=1 Tax=Anaeromonas gelatinilytica TaxID=2683194 RepID=UPI00193AEA81|nr:MerR family transcriptional regulator [Anaeromonas gelatinilytica]MBS4536792.1 MerR family transcriptional regulator [Anaeromonas gelatinilytica]
MHWKIYNEIVGGGIIYKIGEFSQIVGITTKTLRYYDAEGILFPSFRNKDSGYRFYSEEDIEKAEIISNMRKFNFTISEMKDALRNIKHSDDFADYLVEKVALTQDLIDRYTKLILEIQEYLKDNIPIQKKEFDMTYTVSEVEIPAMKIASIRFQGQYHEIGMYFEKLYKVVQNRVTGTPITCYYSLEYSEQADIEVCVPVSEKVNSDGVFSRNLPESKALHVTHIGKYEELKSAYRALFDYANEHHLIYEAPLIEMYEKGYGTTMAGNPEKYITEIYLPIKA